MASWTYLCHRRISVGLLTSKPLIDRSGGRLLWGNQIINRRRNNRPSIPSTVSLIFWTISPVDLGVTNGLVREGRDREYKNRDVKKASCSGSAAEKVLPLHLTFKSVLGLICSIPWGRSCCRSQDWTSGNDKDYDDDNHHESYSARPSRPGVELFGCKRRISPRRDDGASHNSDGASAWKEERREVHNSDGASAWTEERREVKEGKRREEKRTYSAHFNVPCMILIRSSVTGNRPASHRETAFR